MQESGADGTSVPFGSEVAGGAVGVPQEGAAGPGAPAALHAGLLRGVAHAAPEHRVRVLSALEPIQERAFELLEIQPHAAPPLEEEPDAKPEPSH